MKNSVIDLKFDLKNKNSPLSDCKLPCTNQVEISVVLREKCEIVTNYNKSICIYLIFSLLFNIY